MQYQALLAQATTLAAAVAHQETYLMVALAHARCFAELGELAMAHRKLEEAIGVWRPHARRLARTFLLEPHPERLLYGDIAEQAPAAALVEWMQFAYDNPKGYGWIDELRQ